MAEGRDDDRNSPDEAAPTSDPYRAETDPVAAPAEPRRGGSLSTGLIGGLLGGALVGFGGWYYLEYMQPPLPEPAQAAALQATQARLDEVAGRVDPLTGQVDQVAGQVTPLAGRIDELGATQDDLRQRLEQQEQATRELREAAASAPAAGPGGATLGVEALEQRVAALERQPGAAPEGGGEETAALRAQLDQLAAASGPIGERQQTLDQRTGEIAGQLEDLGARLDTLAREQAARLDQVAGQQGTLLPLVGAVAGLQGATAANERAAATAQAAAGEARETLTRDLGALRAELTQQAEAQRAAVTQEQAALAEGLRAEDAARERLVTLALVTETLEEEVAGGAPFAATLGRLRELAGDDPVMVGVVNGLAPVAETGVPSLAALAQSLPQPEDPPPAAAPNETAPSGWLAEAGRNLTGLVSVAPEGTPAAASNELMAARQALADGDLRTAIAMMGPTAATGDAASRDWLLAASRRDQALAAVDELKAHLRSLAEGRA